MTGTLPSVRDVVDTTGAGDAFIGGYLLYYLILLVERYDYRSAKQESISLQACLDFGCWVSGEKVRGIGARRSLPTGDAVNHQLGITPADVQLSLREAITPFHA
jgi:sugar/nucleoside kinase (ribokinase family)